MSTLTERITTCNDAGLKERVAQALAEAGKNPATASEVLPIMVKTLDSEGKTAPYADEDITNYIAGL